MRQRALMLQAFARIVVASFAWLCWLGAGSAPEPTLATIRANIAAAMGTLPPSETLTTSFTRGGVSGIQVELRSGKDYRRDETLGPIHTASGSVGGVAWRQNANGETVLDSVEPKERVPEATTTTVSHVSSPSDLYVIARLTKLGRGTKDYVDPATWHVVRVDTISATETTTTTYADFHTVAGYTRAWSRIVSDGHHENDSTYTITADDVSPIDAARLAVPKDARTLVEFPEDRTSVALPARYDARAQKFIVRVMVGTRGLDFLLDTGASSIVMDRDVVQSLGLQEHNAFSNAANAGRYTETTAIVPQLAVGDLTMRDVVVRTVPDVGMRGDDFKVVGLLGFDFIRDLGLKLDYDAGTVTAYPPNALVVPQNDHRIDLDVTLGSYIPEATVAINGAIGNRFIIDTGGAGALMIFDYFRRRFPDAVVDENHNATTMDFKGVGGLFQADAIMLERFQLGRATFVNSQVYVIDSDKSYGYDQDGIIGPRLLRVFTVYVDLANEKIYLVPHSRAG